MSDELVEIDIPVSEQLATSLENDGFRVAKKTPPSLMSNQLRTELIRILTTGDDKNEGAFTVAVAAQVEKFVVAAREILMTENLAQNDLASLMMMRKGQLDTVAARFVQRRFVRFDGSSMGSSSAMRLWSASFPTVNNENFGVQAIRQIVDAVRTMSESPAKLVEALAVARAEQPYRCRRGSREEARRNEGGDERQRGQQQPQPRRRSVRSDVVKFYIPSWNGDFRLEDDGKGGSKLVVHKPTAARAEDHRRVPAKPAKPRVG